MLCLSHGWYQAVVLHTTTAGTGGLAAHGDGGRPGPCVPSDVVAELVCKCLKAGLLVRPWEQHSAVTPAETIREVIEKVMARDEGLAVRERAKELMEFIRRSVAEGGSSRKDLDDFVAYIAR